MLFVEILVFTILFYPQVVVKKLKQTYFSTSITDEILQLFGSYLFERHLYLCHDKILVICNSAWNLSKGWQETYKIKQ